MFETTKEIFQKKFDFVMEDYKSIEDFDTTAKAFGIHNLKAELKNNTVEFKDFVKKIANAGLDRLSDPKITSVHYAVVVAKIADFYKVPYKKYIGFCLPKDSPKYNDLIEEYNKGKEEGIEHPIYNTHMFIMINNKYYEYFSNTGECDNIEHIDFVEI